MTLSLRLALVMVNVVAVITFGIILFTNYAVETAMTDRALVQIRAQAGFLAHGLEDKFDELKNEVLVLSSTQVLRELVHVLAEENQTQNEITANSPKPRIATFIQNRLSVKPSYLEYSIIGIKDAGREILRVARLDDSHNVHIIPDNELRPRGEVSYFRQTLSLGPREFYVSPIQTVSDVPTTVSNTPILQIATPIHASDGSPFGIIVATVDARSIFNSVRSIMSAEKSIGRVYVVNDRGEFLISVTQTEGIVFAPPKVIDLDIEPAAIPSAENPKTQILTGKNGERFGVAIASARPTASTWFGVMVMVPYSEIVSPMVAVEKATLVVGLTAILGSIVALTLLARSIAHPLVQMSDAVNKFIPGNPLNLPVKVLKIGDEIGTLARSFENMAAEITKRTAELNRESEERVRIKDHFVAMVSHEIRSPLTSISASLGLLSADPSETMPDPAKRLLRIAHSNSLRLGRLINDILDIEKLEANGIEFSLQNLDVRQIVESAIEDNQGYADQYEVRLRLDPESIHATVSADTDRLSQVITNLLSNAVRYSPSKSDVEVMIEDKGKMVRIAVRDHGSGVPETFRTKIFEKFAQADSFGARQKGGTGLGLSIVKQIVIKFGGNVGFIAAPGGGTIFYIDLPRCDQQQAADRRHVLGEAAHDITASNRTTHSRRNNPRKEVA